MQSDVDIKEEEYRKRKRRFLFIWFFFLTIFLSTITYAWFTSNRIVELEFFDIHVETDGGLEISEDAIDWKAQLLVDDLKNAYKTYPSSLNQIPGEMKPMSSGGGVDTNGFLNMFYGQADYGTNGNYYLTTYRKIEERTTDESNHGDFIAFDVFIKSQMPKTIYLSSDSFVRPKEGDSKGIENSARIAFIKEGNLPSESNITTVQNLKTSSDSNVILWEPNYDVHTATGVNHASNVYGITTYATTAAYNTANDSSVTYQPALAYSGVKAPIAADQADYSTNATTGVKWGDATATNYSSLFENVTINKLIASDNDTAASGTHTELMTLKPGVTKLRIYMWIEGQDIDCENNASGGTLIFNLGFEVNEPGTTPVTP